MTSVARPALPARRTAALAAAALVASLLAAVTTAPAHATVDDGDASCDCVEVGPYQEPIASVDPFLSGTAQSATSSARYQVAASGSIPGSTVTVSTTAGGSTVLSTSGDLGSWGFSPDQDRFVTWGIASTGSFDVRVYDLTATTPSASVISLSLPDAPANNFGFSPHGEFFLFTSVFPASADTVNLALYDSRSGSLRYSTTYTYYVPGATGLDEFGQAGWGFSPDDDEFLSMHVSSASSFDGFVVDLDSKVATGLGPKTGTGLWRFSPCGSLVGFALQTNPTTFEASLTDTGNGNIVGSGTFSIVNAQVSVEFFSTGAQHQIVLDGVANDLAPVTPVVPDVCPPTWPAGAALTMTPTGPTTATLGWTAAEDPSGIDGYRVYRGPTLLTTLSGSTLTYDVVGLSPETTYTFRVEASDTLGRWSTTGPTVELTTPGSGPYWTAATLTATDVDGTQVDLAWPAAADDKAVTGYRLYRGGVKIADRTAVQRTWSDTTVEKGTSYSYQVQAIDADGNESTDGPQATVTTTTLTQTGTATITGRIFRDLDGNGVMDGADSPLPTNNNDLYLQIYRVDADGRTQGMAPWSGNPDGTWSTGVLDPGRYVVTVMTYNVFFAGREQYRPAAFQPYVLDVLADAGWSGAEFALSGYLGGAYPMHPDGSASITGLVFHDLDGDGVHDAGEPGLAGYNPSCVRVNTAGGPDCVGVLTGADGTYTRGGLVPGTYLLTPPNLPEGWYRTNGATRLAVLRDPAPGITAPYVEWGVQQGLSTVQGTVWWDKDGDAVKDTGEPPLPAGASARVCIESSVINDCVSVTAGAWSFVNLPPGSYDLTLLTYSAEGWTPTTPPAGQSVTATVATNGSTVTVPPFGADGTVGYVQGIVFSDDDGDGVRDVGELPISGVRVCITKSGVESSWCLTTGADGAYSLVPPAGTVRLNVTQAPPSGTLTTPAELPVFLDVVVDGTTTLDIGYSGAPPPPAAPTGLTASPAKGAAVLAWAASSASPAAPVTDYVIQRSSASTGPWTTVTDAVSATPKATVSGLTNGVRVYFRVAGVNSTGQGSWSSVVSTVPRTVPGVPRSVAAAKGTKTATVKVTWVAPSSNGGSTITSYQVQYSLRSTGPWTTKKVAASARSLVVTGKTGKYVYVRVRAVNAAGYGPWSPVRRAIAR